MPYTHTPPTNAGDEPNLRLLVVEDSPELRALIRLTLDGYHYQIEYAVDGIHALKVFAEYPPQLVLLDIGLPGPFCGLELCTRFRAEGVPPFPVIVLLTADDAPSTIRRAQECGADGYLIKPVSPTQILGLLDTFEAWSTDIRRPVPGFWPRSPVRR